MQSTAMAVSFLLSIIIGCLLLSFNEAKPDLVEVINNIPTRYGMETEIIDYQPNGNEEVIDVITAPNGQQTTQVRDYSAQQVYNTWGRTYGNNAYNNYGYNNGYNNYNRGYNTNYGYNTGYNNNGYNTGYNNYGYNTGYNNYGYNNGYNNQNRGYYNTYYGKK